MTQAKFNEIPIGHHRLYLCHLKEVGLVESEGQKVASRVFYYPEIAPHNPNLTLLSFGAILCTNNASITVDDSVESSDHILLLP